MAEWPLIQIPSKTFLLGEYAVLQKGPALVLAHGPYFSCAVGNQKFHPDSPAGQLAPGLCVQWQDPHQGKGGFGGSGAEFVAAHALQTGKKTFSPEEAFSLREKYEAPGSGVDILVQAFGAGKDPMVVSVNQESHSLEQMPLLGIQARIFHTGKKLLTHENLRGPFPPLSQLAPIIQKATEALRRQDAASFCAELMRYSQTLRQAGLLASHSAEACEKAPKSALALKGCGAMGSDVILLLQEAGEKSPRDWAENHSLVEVAAVAI